MKITTYASLSSSRWLSRFTCTALLSAPLLCSAQFLTPTPNIGAAGGYTIFGLNLTVDSIGGTSHILGDVAVGTNGTLNLQGGSQITGTVYKDPSATVIVGGGSTILGGQVTTALTQADIDAHAASAQFSAAPANQTIAGNVTSSTVFTPIGGTKIIDITGNVNLGGSSTLSFSGTASDYFIVNVGGSFNMGGTASIVLSGGLTPQHLIWNIELNSPSTVGLSLASGTHSFGTFLAVNTSTKIDGGTSANPALTGAIIGDGTAGGTGILIQSTAWISGAPIPIPEPTALALGALAFGLFAFRRRKA